MADTYQSINDALLSYIRRLTVTTVKTSGPYVADYNELVRVDPSGGGFQVTLPDAAEKPGGVVAIKNVTSSTNNITVATGGEDIDGYGTSNIWADSYFIVVFWSDGTNWIVGPVGGTGVGLHAPTHISSGSDEVDGDQLDIDFTPNYYTPSTEPGEASSTAHLTAHLAGIDDLLVGGDPNGFAVAADDTETTITITDGTRTFEIAPTATDFRFWSAGKKFVKTTTQSVVWPDVEGIHYFYFNSSGTLVTSQDGADFGAAIAGAGATVFALYWNATNSVSIFRGEERHGLMDAETHSHLHNAFGSRWYSGGALTIDSGQSGNDDAHAQIAVSDVIYADEDIRYDTSTGSQVLGPIAQIPVFYREGATGVWRKKTADNFPLIYSGTAGYTGGSGLPPWNEYTGATWQLTEVTNNDFFLMHYFASNEVDTPIIAIQGQAEYASLSNARDAADSELPSLLLPIGGLTQELVPLATVIFQAQTGDSNTPSAHTEPLTGGSNDYYDWRISRGGSGTSLGLHAASHLSGASDEIDGDQLDIDYTPTNYTPATTPAEVTSVDHLTAHLYGIDQALTGGGGDSHDLADDTVNALHIREGSNLYGSFTTTNSGEYIQFGDATAVPALAIGLEAGTAGMTLSSQTGQFLVQFETGADALIFADSDTYEWLNIDGTGETGGMYFGNTDVNPDYFFLGSGVVTTSGSVSVSGGITIEDTIAAFFIQDAGDFTFDSTGTFQVTTTDIAYDAIKFDASAFGGIHMTVGTDGILSQSGGPIKFECVDDSATMWGVYEGTSNPYITCDSTDGSEVVTVTPDLACVADAAVAGQITTQLGIASGLDCYVGGHFYVQDDQSASISNTTAETAFSKETSLMPANSLVAGRRLRIHAVGTVEQTQAGSEPLTLRVRLNDGVSTSLDLLEYVAAADTSDIWEIDAWITVYTIGSQTTRTVICSGGAGCGGAAGFSLVQLRNKISATYDETKTWKVQVTAEWTNMAATNIVWMDDFLVELH
jgi:hypothetical protein